MDRALDPALIALVLGDAGSLPTPQEFAQKVADVEAGLFAGWVSEPDPELLSAAWYLHGIASFVSGEESIDASKSRSAFQVSAHFFDLQLGSEGLDETLRRRYLFAAQVGYVRSGLTPNAHAVFRREWSPTQPESIADTESVALTIGCLVLAGLHRPAYRLADKILSTAGELAQVCQLRDLGETQFEAIMLLCRGAYSLGAYLRDGNPALLESAQELLLASARSEAASGDLDSRWVAAHLLGFAQDLGSSSVWSVLPPEIPNAVARAFVLGKPRVSMLWPPQLEALNKEPWPITDGRVRRAVLSLPTSGGKSLLAQVIAAVHLARGESGVCYVAPTRSLCREVDNTFDNRLRYIRNAKIPRQEFKVLTPERLYASLRYNPNEVLDRYGLFIFDEAQSIGDGARGWVLESSLALLHAATRETHHRIIAISPAAGNLAQFATWTGADEEGQVVAQSDWRAPRRLNAVYSPEPRWEEAADSTRRSVDWPIRRSAPMYGQIRLRIANVSSMKSLHFTEPVGTLALQISTKGAKKKEDSHSTAQYLMRLPMIEHLGRAGSVLVLVGTRPACVLYATALAKRVGVDNGVPLSLLSYVSGKLGEEHPLSRSLASGVAYHHGALPSDVQSAIEEAVRAGDVRYLIATTTLTEGINLPVRSVLLAESGYHDGTEYRRVVFGSKLMNAVGRAGRALAETEGWAVLADSHCTDDEFCGTDGGFEALKIESSLLHEDALESLCDLEEQMAAGESVVSAATGVAADFVSFNWFVMEACARLRDRPFSPEAQEVLESTLAWSQMSDASRARWLSIASASKAAYEEEEPTRRRRWVQSGLPLSTAVHLESLAEALKDIHAATRQVTDPMGCLELLEESDMLSRVLRLPGAPKINFWAARRGNNRIPVSVDLALLLHDWLEGLELSEIAARHLHAVVDLDFRDEQLADAINKLFSDYLPWVLSVLLQWSYELAETSAEPVTFGQLLRQFVEAGGELPEDLLSMLEQQSPHMVLPALIRYGVNDEVALLLTRSGVSSRSLAVEIASEFLGEGNENPEELTAWLCALGIDEWKRRFDPSPLALRELLKFARAETSTLLGDVLDEKIHRIPIELEESLYEDAPVTIRPFETAGGAIRLAVVAQERVVGFVPLSQQHDAERLIELDLPLNLRVEIGEEAILAISMDRARLLDDVFAGVATPAEDWLSSD